MRGKYPPEARDPPFLITPNPVMFTSASSPISADAAKPCLITMEYNGPSGGRARGEGLQGVDTLSAYPASLAGEVVTLPQEVVHQEVIEQEVIVGGDTPLNDVMPAVETFNVDEIPRAEELVEIVDEQGQLHEEEVQSSPAAGERRPAELTQVLPASPLLGQDPMVQAAMLLPSHSFLQQLLGYYSKPPPDAFQLWADEGIPPDVMPKGDTAPYLTTFTTQTEAESPGSAILSSSGPTEQPSAYICPECRACFSLLHQFQDHLLTHPDPPDKKFLCQFCGKRFLRADHLNRHTVLHKDIQVFKCRSCGEEFLRASHLDKHRRKAHGTRAPATPGAKRPGDASGKPAEGSNLHLLAAVASPEGRGGRSSATPPITEIVLQSCSVPVAQVEETVIAEDNFDEDYEEEAGYPFNAAEPDRPFSCDQCGRKFIRITHLRRHMRIHTGERPFLCHICGRRYARGDYLRAHIQAHRKERMHKCKVCGEVFLDLMRFSEHCRSHSIEEFELADMRTDRKVTGGAEVYQPTSREMAAVIDGELGEIVSMVTIPTSEEVVISNEISPIVSLTTELPGTSLAAPPTSSGLDPPPLSGNSAVRSLLQDASRNVHFQEALLSLGEWVGL